MGCKIFTVLFLPGDYRILDAIADKAGKAYQYSSSCISMRVNEVLFSACAVNLQAGEVEDARRASCPVPVRLAQSLSIRRIRSFPRPTGHSKFSSVSGLPGHPGRRASVLATPAASADARAGLR